jgi:hypothetical protein
MPLKELNGFELGVKRSFLVFKKIFLLPEDFRSFFRKASSDERKKRVLFSKRISYHNAFYMV